MCIFGEPGSKPKLILEPKKPRSEKRGNERKGKRGEKEGKEGFKNNSFLLPRFTHFLAPKAGKLGT